jgi:DNA-binding transcriptional ArsR family regulator
MASRGKQAPPLPELVLTEVSQLRALSDALRLQIVEIMHEEPARAWAAKELAERLGTKQTKLYHHLGLLEEAGIIRVAETRLVSGIQEKRYGVAARSFRVDRALLTGTDEDATIGRVLDAMFERARADIVASIQAGLISLQDTGERRRRMALSATHARLGPKQIERVMELIEELGRMDQDPDPNGLEYGFVVGFYPRVTKEQDR